MKTMLAILAFVFLLGARPVFAGDPKTLPSEFYAKLAHRGTKVSYVWTAPSFQKGKGITFDGKIDWKAADRVSVFYEALRTGLQGISTLEGEYRLEVSVVHADANWVLSGDFVIEGKLVAKDGTAVAYFYSKEIVGTIKAFETQVRRAADSLVAAVDAEFLR